MNGYRITMFDGDHEVSCVVAEPALRQMIAGSIVSGVIASSKIEGEETDDLPVERMINDCAKRIPEAMLTIK